MSASIALLVMDEPHVGPTVWTPFSTFSNEVPTSLAMAFSTLSDSAFCAAGESLLRSACTFSC